MGLDMYLYLRRSSSLGKWDKNYEQRKADYYPPELEGFKESLEIRDSLSKSEMFQVGYWRKANAIHGWIIKNCANGEDHCQNIYMDLEDVKKLRNAINRVLAKNDLAEELLPVQEGFFFGNQKYDEWYFKNLEYTKDLLDKIIVFVQDYKGDGYFDVIYNASW